MSEAAENQAEVTLVAETDFEANFRNGNAGIGKEFLSLFNTEMIEVGDEGLTGEVLEGAAKMRRAHIHGFGGLAERDGFREVLFKELKDRLEAVEFAMALVEGDKGFLERSKMIQKMDENHLDVGLDAQTGAIGVGGEFCLNTANQIEDV